LGLRSLNSVLIPPPVIATNLEKPQT